MNSIIGTLGCVLLDVPESRSTQLIARLRAVEVLSRVAGKRTHPFASRRLNRKCLSGYIADCMYCVQAFAVLYCGLLWAPRTNQIRDLGPRAGTRHFVKWCYILGPGL